MTGFTRKLHQGRARTLAFPAHSETALKAVFILTLVLLVASYVAFLNSMTKKTFEIKKLQSRVTELKRQSAKVESELARAESIANVAERVSTLGMVTSDKVDYITIGSAAVAFR